MAEDLPYFKFFVSEWNDGDVALEDYEVQGLFINLCSYYWSNECYLLFSKAEKKFKDAPEDLWQTLIENKLIKEVDKYLVISFLDEQKEERKQTSKRNSDAGKLSAEKRRLAKLQEETNEKLTPVGITLNGNPTNKKREEEIREDKRREDIKRFSFRKSLYDLGLEKSLVDDFLKNRKLKRLANTETAFKNLVIEFNKNEIPINELFEMIVSNGWGSFKNSWLNGQSKEIENKSKDISDGAELLNVLNPNRK